MMRALSKCSFSAFQLYIQLPRLRQSSVPKATIMQENSYRSVSFPSNEISLSQLCIYQPQTFAGNPLDRSIAFDGRSSLSQDIVLLIVAARQIGLLGHNELSTGLDLCKTTLKTDSANLILSESPSLVLSSRAGNGEEEAKTIPLYALGLDASQRWHFVLNATGESTAVQAWVESQQLASNGSSQTLHMQDMRSALGILDPVSIAIAGLAVALCQWHQSHGFCHHCGAPSLHVAGGRRRRCTADPKHVMFPRTDPVAIVLVTSRDGTRALLGRGKAFMPGMYTCLSGFVEQAESLEEAVAREVQEESGVRVGEVRLAGSQPWPIGRSGANELMLGCYAVAEDETVTVNKDEMDDVRWFSRAEVVAAVQAYEGVPVSEQKSAQEHCLQRLGFFLPQPVAIAYHIIRAWALPGQQRSSNL